jgi:hypothetical protein
MIARARLPLGFVDRWRGSRLVRHDGMTGCWGREGEEGWRRRCQERFVRYGCVGVRQGAYKV